MKCLCFLILILLSLFCHGSKLTNFEDATEEFTVEDRVRRHTLGRTSATGCYFKNHLIHNNNNELCTRRRTKRHRQPWMENFPLATLAQLIQSHRNSPSVRSIQNLPAPFTEVLVKDVVNQRNKAITIPLALKATIRFNNKPTTRRPSIPSNIFTQMRDMGAIPPNANIPDGPFDDTGHLLAWNLGGGMNNVWNYVPQINRLNRNTHEGGTSSWQEEERNIAKFLERNQQGYVDWSMLVVYDDSNVSNFRPRGFCMQYSASDNRGIRTDRNEMCFGNDPNDECFYDERDPCTGLPIDS